ncbi:probable aspartic proteinase GIP2 [Mercurialis annua]|uniref:probable aspartic proteinase GIP2 n=1 Tax=Mercurialis annua TaxID=3986 RepID=UPI002160AB3F|nr:probable aspartic proteinase GIP2 [Mercurialis annua]
MASLFHSFLFISSLIFFISPSTSKPLPSHPKSLVLSITKDKWSLQHTTQISQRTPLVAVKLTVDLGGRFIWTDCETGYFSSSFKPVKCNSPICSLSNSGSCISDCEPNPKAPVCTNRTCQHLPDNRVAFISDTGDIRQDIVSFRSLNGRNVSIPDFPFVCSSTSVLDKLADGVTGVAGLGRSNISIPAYSSSAFGFSKKFSMCLSSSTKSNGVVIIGDGPYPTGLLYTPLILNPDGVTAAAIYYGEPSADYFIGLKSIRFNGKELKINKTLLSIAPDGSGGTMLSTIQPYTTLHSSIYKVLLKAVTKNLNLWTKVIPRMPVPFDACYRTLGTEAFAKDMAPIDLVLGSVDGKSEVIWRISGENSIVTVDVFTVCFAFLDGGTERGITNVIIGGYQLEENFLQFDIANSRLGFTSNLSATRNTACSSLNLK